MGQIDKIDNFKLSMKKLEILSEYIGPAFTDTQSYRQGLQVVLEGNIKNVYVPDVNIANEEYRKKVIGNFSRCLLSFMKCYGISHTREIVSSDQLNNNKNKTL